jgi:hypothetical protein
VPQNDRVTEYDADLFGERRPATRSIVDITVEHFDTSLSAARDGRPRTGVN